MPNSATLVQALGAAFCAILCALSGMGGGGMMIGARTATLAKSGAPLPYDAEVEWLGGDGESYITFPRKVTPNSRIAIEYYRGNLDTQYVFGSCRIENNSTALFMYHERNNNNLSRQVCRPTSITDLSKNVFSDWFSGGGQLSKKFSLEFNPKEESITYWNGTVKPCLEVDFAIHTNTTLFGVSKGDGTGPYSKSTVKICSFKWWEDDEPIYDLKPVRLNGIGYMFDSVSGINLPNEGTGAFVIGPDKR